ncbi:MAG: segregation/condensation protein A [Actinomycetales bacterium]|nr:segregation/condensation protein A [Actinomycetales bacterium]
MNPPAAVAADDQVAARGAADGFSVRVGEFEGPFDLLLSLISKHKLEVTELALHLVTDEFIGYIRAKGSDWDLDEASSFLVVAATLLDLKAARLLPSGEVEDEDDLALLEARDLLFARLLQYRAFKEVAAILSTRMTQASRQVPRSVGLEPHFAALLPEVLIGLSPEQFAAMAARALAPKPAPEVSVAHVHVQRVSVREQASIIVDRLRRQRTSTFRALISDCDTTLLVVGRFLALLELYREAMVAFEQITPLGDLTIRWTGTDEGEVEVTGEFDVERDIDREASQEQALDSPGDQDDAALAVGQGVGSAVEVEDGSQDPRSQVDE